MDENNQKDNKPELAKTEPGDNSVRLPNPAREADNGVNIKLSKRGWYLIHRQLWDDEEFPTEPFSEREAWIWLIGAAAFEDKTVYFNKRNIPVKRGQFVTSVRFLCKTFIWSNSKVYGLLKRLSENGKILRQQQDSRQTMITICNYDLYQDMRNSKKTQTDTVLRQCCDSDATRLTNITNTTKETKDILPFTEIVDDLNYNCHTNFKHSSEKTRSLIKARWSDGFRLDDFKTVHRKKANEWLNSEMAKYLRPETLYSNKFEGYLNQTEINHLQSRFDKSNPQQPGNQETMADIMKRRYPENPY